MKSMVLTALLFITLSCRDTPSIQRRLTKDANVILLTLDGVRYQEFFNRNLMKTYWKKYASKGIVIGDPQKQSKVKVANLMVLSLPAYRTMHLGTRTFCKTNACGFVIKETLGEKILRKLNLSQNKVAVISSWPKICQAAMQKTQTLFQNCGNTSLDQEGHEEINASQEEDWPRWNGRYDKYTWSHGIKYIQKNKPKFLHLSLLDSDEYGHLGKWKEYIQSIKNYDGYIDELFTLLDSLGEYGKKTTVIITTDHGRGKGKRWKGHTLSPASAKIFMSVHGPDVPGKGSVSHKKKITHLHLRPYIELLLGLKNIRSRYRLSDLVFQ